MLSLLFGLWVIKLGGDAIIVGLAVNLLAVGLTAYLTLPVFGVQGSFDDPALQGLPTLWGHSPLVYLGAALVPATWWLLLPPPVRGAAARGRRGRRGGDGGGRSTPTA